MINPKEIRLKSFGGVEKTFIMYELPYFAGREIITQFPITAAPKIGDYRKNEELAAKMFAYVAVKLGDGGKIMLETKELVENHCNLPCGLMLEKSMLEHNADFLNDGEILNFLNTLIVKAKRLITSTLTDWPELLSQREKPPSKNLKRSTRSKTRS